MLLVGYDAKKRVASAAWIDSWHSSVKPLMLAGTIDEQTRINLRGKFEVPNQPDWGWRIVINAAENDLQIVMYNVSPQGAEELAVRSNYKRAV